MAAFGSVSLALAVSLLAATLNTWVDAAPAERGLLARPGPFLRLGHQREIPDSPNIPAERETTGSSADTLSGRLTKWIRGSVPTGLTHGPERTSVATANAMATATAKAKASAMAKASAKAGLVRVPRSSPETSGPDRATQMLKIISTLEQMFRTVNGTLRKRITFMPRANGRNSSKKNKVVAASEPVSRATTALPLETGGTASRASTDHVVSGRGSKKSIPPPPPKKSNKRVCFWKYCSQN